ncbi:hypothetical protein A2797_00280 [candidate division WWE3 bacterium RIFCSPHIGHO2_01_FULL_48_15]|uniref:Uncharacterized protein n=1 Tax=candidate division WWE3 bacterium RIFCSPHIGHO2_01_FULL_48_15 TaxID=1802619 RepID=A0A1F4VD33_UNCKA|nr:MAG: hypothetical protein A2797_00280 [candidate division WWE3 bacterium RIFCSPHIGHO2_01_FULL_48_15]
MTTRIVPEWFRNFVEGLRCGQDNSYLAKKREYRYMGENWVVAALCYQDHPYIVICLLRLTPEIAGDMVKEAAEATNLWRNAYFGLIQCSNCPEHRFENFSFNEVSSRRATVYQYCARCRTVKSMTMFWVYQEKPPKITKDDVLDAHEILKETTTEEQLLDLLKGKKGS